MSVANDLIERAEREGGGRFDDPNAIAILLGALSRELGQHNFAPGVEFKDFTTSIAAIAPLFASGSDAGTSYKVFLQSLVPKSKSAAEAMERLGLEFFDAQGNMKDMGEISSMLNAKLKDDLYWDDDDSD